MEIPNEGECVGTEIPERVGTEMIDHVKHIFTSITSFYHFKTFFIFFLSFSARIILPLPIGLFHWHPLTDAICIFILFYFMVIISLFCTSEIVPLWQLFFPNYVTEAVENCSQVPTFRPWMTTLLVKISSQLLIIAVFI